MFDALCTNSIELRGNLYGDSQRARKDCGGRRAVDRALLLRQHAEQKMFGRSKKALVISEAMSGVRARVMTDGAA
jgi:hypothetical protein